MDRNTPPAIGTLGEIVFPVGLLAECSPEAVTAFVIRAAHPDDHAAQTHAWRVCLVNADRDYVSFSRACREADMAISRWNQAAVWSAEGVRTAKA